MGLQEAAVHLRPFNLITLLKRQKEQRNQETTRNTSPTEMVLPHKSELLLAPEKSVCLGCFSVKLGFCITAVCLLPSRYCWPTPNHCWPTPHHCWPREGLEGNYISLGLVKAGFPWEAQVSLIHPQSCLKP